MRIHKSYPFQLSLEVVSELFEWISHFSCDLGCSGKVAPVAQVSY